VSALEKVATFPKLERAWRNIHSRARAASRNTRGVDGVSLNDFAIDPKPRLRTLARDLASGEYEFAPLRPHLIPKTNGKDRLICVPTVGDRIVQRALLNFLTSKYLSRLQNEISYGFVQGRTVQDAARLACAYRSRLPWVFKTDIASFFDRIPRALLASAVTKIIREKSFHVVLNRAAACEIQTPSGNAQSRIHALGIREGLGVRQGMPLSPFFANIILDRFDRAVAAAGHTAIRYADDLIFFADNEASCRLIHAFCRRELAKIGLTVPDIVPDSKSQIYAPTVAAEFLGLGMCPSADKYILRLMPKQIERIRTELMQLGSISQLLTRGITLAKLGAQIQNRSTGYLNAYEACTNISDVENELSDLTQKVLRKIYREGLGLKLEKLSAEARTFLGLN